MYTLSPVGLAAAPVANQLSIQAAFKEKLCRPFCVDSSVQPQVSVVYTHGTPSLEGTTTFIPVSAVITVVSPECGCKATTQLFTENFFVVFQGQTEEPTSVTITSVGRTQGGSCVTCGKARSYTLVDSLQIAITTPTE